MQSPRIAGIGTLVVSRTIHDPPGYMLGTIISLTKVDTPTKSKNANLLIEPMN